MPQLSFLRRHLLDALVVVVAAVACLPWLVVFREGFAVGATWSGLNSGGGGPGFTLLATVGLLSFFGRSEATRSLPAMRAVVHAAVLSIAFGIVFVALVSGASLLSPEALTPLVSGVMGAFFVPRVVVAVLEEGWAVHESDEGRGGRP